MPFHTRHFWLKKWELRAESDVYTNLREYGSQESDEICEEKKEEKNAEKIIKYGIWTDTRWRIDSDDKKQRERERVPKEGRCLKS